MAELREVTKDVLEVSKKLIDTYHQRLQPADIKFLFRTDEWKFKGNTVPGRTVRATPDLKYFNEFDFIIKINEDIWKNSPADKKEALLDHLLTYCGRGDDDDEGSPTWKINQPTISDFPSIIERHGLWNQELEKLGKANDQFEQMSIIPLDEARKEKEKKTGTDN